MPRAPKPKKPTAASHLATLRAVEAEHPKKATAKPPPPPPPRSPTPPGRSPSYSPPPRAAVFASRAEYVEAYDMWERLNPGHREGGPDDEFAPNNTQI
jgi:hypothetical protein